MPRAISTKKITAEIEDILKRGGVGVLPTDTLYGIVGSALSKKAVLRIYKLRRRNPKKPMIILAGSLGQLKIFGIKIDRKTGKILRKLWPGKVSIVFSCGLGRWLYLHRGSNSLAFRLPRNKALANFLKKTGPLVAPTANFEGEPPARNIKEAKRYFGNRIDFYLDSGPVESGPSTLVKIEKEKIVVLRPGSVKIKS